jgi:Na+-translocating ferredoxin:NAD+ oxidoreductase RNF subunit RnfB
LQISLLFGAQQQLYANREKAKSKNMLACFHAFAEAGQTYCLAQLQLAEFKRLG